MIEKNTYQKVGLYGIAFGVLLVIVSFLANAGVLSSIALIITCVSILLKVYGDKKAKK